MFCNRRFWVMRYTQSAEDKFYWRRIADLPRLQAVFINMLHDKKNGAAANSSERTVAPFFSSCCCELRCHWSVTASTIARALFKALIYPIAMLVGLSFDD